MTLGIFQSFQTAREANDIVFSALMETNRGCPFHCAYCDWGSIDLKKGTRFECIAAVKDVGNQRIDIVTSGSCEETKMTEVDAKNRNIPATDEVDGAEQGTVATDGEEEIIVDADRQSIGDLVSFDTAGVQTVDKGQQLLAQRRFEVADVEGNFHLKLKTNR